MKKKQKKEYNLQNGRDELNLAEFPICSVYRIPKEERKNLVFYNEILDSSTKTEVKRKVTITASEKHGLLSALDDEVLLGLVQLSKLDNFKSRKVFF